MVSNVLPLRLAVHPSMTVSEVIGEASSQIHRGIQHQRYQVADLRRDLWGTADGQSPFGVNVNIMRFNYDFSFAGNGIIAHNLSLGPVSDLSIAFYERSGNVPLRIDFDANPALHASSDLADRQQTFLRLLTAIVDPERAIGSLDILGEEERDTILQVWNDTAQPVPPATLPELFAAQVAKTPDAIAVAFEEQTLSYGELDRRANRLAHHLRALGVGPETVVGLCLARSLDMIVGLLAILKAGGAYLPLDPEYPTERLRYMIADAGARVLLTHGALIDRLPAQATSIVQSIVRLDADADAIAAQPARAPAVALDPRHPAYVIYTSGSTGTPKGVVGTHDGTANRIIAQTRIKPFLHNDTCCQKTSIGFVDSIFEIFGPLSMGSPLVIVPDAASGNPEQLTAIIESAQITRLITVPSLAAMLASEPGAKRRLGTLSP